MNRHFKPAARRDDSLSADRSNFVPNGAPGVCALYLDANEPLEITFRYSPLPHHSPPLPSPRRNACVTMPIVVGYGSETRPAAVNKRTIGAEIESKSASRSTDILPRDIGCSERVQRESAARDIERMPDREFQDLSLFLSLVYIDGERETLL